VTVAGFAPTVARPRTAGFRPATAAALRTTGLAALLFLVLASAFFLLVGRNPAAMFALMFQGSFGGGYALSETLVKTAPILLCALATVLPARLGLISVGAEGQLTAGALAGTALVLAVGDRWGAFTKPAMLLAAAAGGAGLGALAGFLRARLRVNETISTLLLNYIAPLFVDYLVYGPWKDPQSLGWPSTVMFPEAARLPTFFGTRVHLGLVLGLGLVLAAHFVLSRTRWGFYLDVLRSSPALARRAGLGFGAAALVVMAVGGACAGLAGIAEASVLEGRLQSGVGATAGYSGFLVAWLARGRLPLLVPLAVLVAGLAASGDNLQLAADLPSATTYVMQGLLFAAALIAAGRRPGDAR
jgi:simple sugar transport system permease protein